MFINVSALKVRFDQSKEEYVNAVLRRMTDDIAKKMQTLEIHSVHLTRWASAAKRRPSAG